MTADPRGGRPLGSDALSVEPFDSADYELLWPRELVVRELQAVRAVVNARERRERIEFLLDEVFVGESPAHDFAAATTGPEWSDDPWGSSPASKNTGETEEGYLDRLVAHLPRLREYHEPTPYWPVRHGQPDRGHVGSARAIAAHRFAALIRDLHGRGYFGRAMPPPCVDDYEPVDEAAVLEERLGILDLWPLRPDSWDEATLFGLIEVFHDLAVRPRERNMHSYGGCGWHYSGFSLDTGRALYRWRTNRLLSSSGLPLQLAESGEGTGRLVRTVDNGRTELLEKVLQTPTPDVRDRVDHAVALFRARTATVHDKRSAVITLAGILEERRELIRDKIGKKDEGALFQIANEFAIRHQRRGQHGDYDPIFLDWIFWTYLATVELTDRLLDRPRTPGTSSETDPGEPTPSHRAQI